MPHPLIDRAKRGLARVNEWLKPESTGDIYLAPIVAGEEDDRLPTDHLRLHMHLTWRDQAIGDLKLDGHNAWHFAYAEAFKHQTRILPLFEFPNLEQAYECRELWPFFASRIPSPNQPDVLAVANRKEIDLHDTALMLREFGCRTITNPYVLAPAT